MKVPKLMATQHPDSTVVLMPQDEVEEAIQDVLPLDQGGRGCDEKMVDYEGKATPYNQMRDIIEEVRKYDVVPGEDFLITPRVPNPKLEDKDRHLLAITAAVTANMYSQMYFNTDAIKYIILPMSTSTLELAEVQRRILKVERLVSEEFSLRIEEWIKLIPLFETAESHMHIDEIVEGLRIAFIKEIGMFENEFRIFMGKSDSGIHSGHIASSIGVRMGLLKLWNWQKDTMFKVYPIIGMGKPPLRGHMAEWVIEDWVEAWRGYYTATVQSALRFNTDRKDYVHTITVVTKNSGKQPPLELLGYAKEMVNVAWRASEVYLSRLERLADMISFMAKFVTRTRARLDSYKRRAKTGKEMPRAIRFCASLYSMGLGPTLIGAGVIEELASGTAEKLEHLLKFVPLLPKDFAFDYAFTDLEVFKRYVDEKTFEIIKKDVDVVKEYFANVEPPKSPPEGYFEKLRELRGALDEAEVSRAKAIVMELAEMRGFLG
ncbi:phosphoenolpyruvate carboxylase [Ignicoccus hospitalis]|uniref:Phosphoenolpyruvate carboxylase n=1 Tax=Ignicoccus hospitalis (strain KIN4/I / DSM 18386 / JCM 14125) TaxID=453591 RepID=A8A9C2_IGNH4|nr:phosphoenolpyruvate carboxylase [Ignicoccus hospitalis]ABU81524.1 Phosphoenolpyruvate carboxylase [Ignicoccus hospitalis KIN4/I]HIH90459.1 phosphoenolpyruvate carboxylase [Desulfurococcaceae archaeon]